ncbi:MAG: ribonuclease III [Clostridia bacterium]|nr:ribonuclease III [Clostridia bacterium]
MDIHNLERELGYSFNDISLLEHALVHKSTVGNERLNSNERLEFLGDAVLQLSISSHLFKKYEKMPEGNMAKLRASLVCQSTLAKMAKQLNLGEILKLGKGEILSDGMEKPSILSDAVEAVLGAIFIDGGFDKACEVVLNLFKPFVELYLNGMYDGDYKTKLQEILQKNGNVLIKYTITGQSGMPHDMDFAVDVSCNGKVIGSGTGKSKKSAEQSAAKCAIDSINAGKGK